MMGVMSHDVAKITNVGIYGTASIPFFKILINLSLYWPQKYFKTKIPRDSPYITKSVLLLYKNVKNYQQEHRTFAV
jgi:hypothetical protein